MSAPRDTAAALLRNGTVVAFVYIAAAAWLFGMWVWGADTVTTAVNGDPRSTLTGLIHGTANRPFVERVLVPTATRAVAALLPASWHEAARHAVVETPKLQREAARLGWETDAVAEYLIAFSIAGAALIALPFVCRRLFAALYDTDPAVVNVAPLAVLAALPPLFLVGTHYIYDFPALLFFSAGLLLLIRRRWQWYYPLFVLGCLNKETMVLLLAALLLLHSRTMERRTLALHGGAHLALFLVVKGALMIAFASNPGGSLEWHLFGNIHNLLMPYSMGTLLTALAVILLVFADWHAKHPALRQLAWLAVPFLLLMLCFAWLQELRDLYEVVPIVVFLALHTVAFTWGRIPFALKPLSKPTIYRVKGVEIEHGR